MNVFSINWWVSTLVSTLVTMCFIYAIKKFTAKVNIPVVSDMAANV